MSRPESDPDYLAGCVDAFLGAMREADAMIANGTTGQELADLLRHASELLDIIAEGLDGLKAPGQIVIDLKKLRRLLVTARGRVAGPSSARIDGCGLYRLPYNSPAATTLRPIISADLAHEKRTAVDVGRADRIPAARIGDLCLARDANVPDVEPSTEPAERATLSRNAADSSC